MPYRTPLTLMSIMRWVVAVVLVDEAAQLHDPGVVDQHVQRPQLGLGLRR